MVNKFLDNDGNVSPDSISSEEDLKLNGRCQSCGKHISKLKPFGKAGDLLVHPDKRTIILPITKMTGDNITNYSVKGTRLVELVFVTGCGEDIDFTCQVIDEAIRQDDRVLAGLAPMGVVSELADGSLNFKVSVWTSANDYRGFYYDITEKVKKWLDAERIRIPLPT